jgi:hypothetical protein
VPRFIAVHSNSQLSEEQVREQLRNPQQASPARCRRSYFDFQGRRVLAEWEAPSREDVERQLQAMRLQYDEIIPVRLADFARQELEPDAEIAAG